MRADSDHAAGTRSLRRMYVSLVVCLLLGAVWTASWMIRGVVLSDNVWLYFAGNGLMVTYDPSLSLRPGKLVFWSRQQDIWFTGVFSAHISQANRSGFALKFKPILVIAGIASALLAVHAKRRVEAERFQRHRAIVGSIAASLMIISTLHVIAMTLDSSLEHFPWPLAIGVPLLVVLYDIRLRRTVHPPGYCLKCGYNLTGNVSGRCPECGTTIPRTIPERMESDHA